MAAILPRTTRSVGRISVEPAARAPSTPASARPRGLAARELAQEWDRATDRKADRGGSRGPHGPGLGVLAALLVDPRELLELCRRMGRQLRELLRPVGVLHVGLRAHRHELPGSHRPGREPGDASRDDRPRRRTACCDTDHQARRRDQPIVRPQDCSAQPARPTSRVPLGVPGHRSEEGHAITIGARQSCVVTDIPRRTLRFVRPPRGRGLGQSGFLPHHPRQSVSRSVSTDDSDCDLQ